MTLSKSLQDLLARLPPGEQLEFGSLLAAIDAVRFTGPLTVDFMNGRPRQISLGQPVRLAICHADPPASEVGLDIPRRSRAG